MDRQHATQLDVAGAVFIVRHGATTHNLGDERLRGWLDMPLAAAGIHAARHAGRALQPYQPTRLYSSDLQRALDTAKIMSVTLTLTPLSTKELRPWDLGQLAGQTVSAVKDQLERFTTTERDIAPPGSSESFSKFLARAKATVVKYLQLARRVDEPIVLVTHARYLYALEEILFGNPIPYKGPPEPGAVVRLAGPVGEVVMSTVYEGRATATGAIS